MILDISSRRSGKTTRAVQWVTQKDNRFILVGYSQTRDSITKSFNLPKGKVQTITEFRGYGLKDPEVYIEEASFTLSQLLHAKVSGMSMSGAEIDSELVESL